MTIGAIIILAIVLAAGGRALGVRRRRKTARILEARTKARKLLDRAVKVLLSPDGGPEARACVQNVLLSSRRQRLRLADLGTSAQELGDLMRRALSAPSDRLARSRPPAAGPRALAVIADWPEERRQVTPSPVQSGGRNFYPVLDLDKGEPTLELELVHPAKKAGR